ncbi:MAG: hypothetical protein CMF94_02760, partial [Candidatus Marinimicrobia bacterium]|nr:hypothetical protein [Candidatus Neomarinimicrobiota bacterium]
MKISKKEYIFLLFFLFDIFGCENKRDAIGADNEIRVICSDVDKHNVRRFLEMVFNDTLFTPEPEPFYVLKFSTPNT